MDMITSTPVSPKTRRRASNVHAADEVNDSIFKTPRETPLRKSSGPLSLRRGSTQSDLLTDGTDVDEELERSDRRNKNEVIRNVSSIPAQNISANESYKFSGEQDMKTHLQICTKLFVENKINGENVWELHIIDLLRHLLKKPEKNILQMASTSLDISARVYGVRVDNLHAGGLKLASSLAKMSANTRESVEDDDNPSGPEENDENANKQLTRKKKRKRLVAGEKNTIAKDPKSLFGPVPKLESVSFSTKINSDTNAIDNLFTNVLPMDHSGYYFTFLTNERACPFGKCDPFVSEAEVHKKFPAKISFSNKNFKLCAPFNDFIIDQWDVDKEERRNSELYKFRNEDVAVDDDGIPIAVLDGSMHDFQMDDDDGAEPMEVDEPQNLCAELHNEVAHITQFRPEDATKTEYSYNLLKSTNTGTFIYQIWAGPSHWKLKNIKRCTAKYSGVVTDKTAAKCKRKTNFVQSTSLKVSGLKEFEVNKKNAVQKKKSTIDCQKTTLPIPETSLAGNNIWENFCQLLTKAGIKPHLKSNKENKNQGDHDVSVYNYENPNDSQYCANSADHVDNDGGDDHDNMDDNLGDEEVVVEREQRFEGDNLIDAPESVPQTYMHMFSMRAKKMDMRKLKTATWETLKDECRNCTGKFSRTDEGHTTFSQVYKSLPKYLNNQMKAELSPALAFLSLLHLTNENNLELEQLTIRDFKITGSCLK